VPIRVHKAGSPTTVKFSTPQEIIISHLDDSIRLGDGTTLFTSSSKGAKTGLDVFDQTGATAPVVTNITTGGAGTQSSHIFPIGTRKYLMRARGAAVLQFAFVAGTTDTTYVTLRPRAVYTEDYLCLSSAVTIYFQSNTVSTDVEILSWS